VNLFFRIFNISKCFSGGRFLCSYLRTLRNLKDLPVETLITVKQVIVEARHPPTIRDNNVQPIPWCKPPPEWVKLTVYGLFKGDTGGKKAFNPGL
jgi:hypothetical protein